MLSKQEEHILLKTTVYIRMCDSNNKQLGAATGFFIWNEKKNKWYLITNNHVINKSNLCALYLTVIDNGMQKNETVIFDTTNKVIQHQDYDLCLLDITKEHDDLISANKIPIMTFVPFDKITTDFSSFKHIEDIYMVGYPNELINANINYPIVRKGITATGLCDNLNDEHAFIVDIPVYGGSSGSPIFYIDSNNKVKLVGITAKKYYEEDNLFELDNNGKFIENVNKFIKVPNGLGYAVKANVILDLFNNLPRS